MTPFARRRSAPASPSPSTAKPTKQRPSFDAIINFLPASHSDARGALATTHAVASHNKLLLRQTILTTTATQRFLVPIENGPKPRLDGGGGRFGSGQRGRPVATPKDVPSELANGAKKRWSTTLVALFGSSTADLPSSSKRSALPTPPISRPNSSEDTYAPRRPSGSLDLVGGGVLPKLIHVLPFQSSSDGAGAARLVRNLEAFLLSWSFGGARGGGEDTSGDERAMVGGSTSVRTLRPYLLGKRSRCKCLIATLTSNA